MELHEGAKEVLTLIPRFSRNAHGRLEIVAGDIKDLKIFLQLENKENVRPYNKPES